MLIKYDEEEKKILDYDVINVYTIGEMAVIISAFKRCLEDWGYKVKRIEE